MLRRVGQVFKKLDMFSTAEFLRYREETEYATFTGACLSVGIIAIIFLLVYQVLLQTIHKDNITWSQTTIKQNPPSNITMGLDSMKFAIHLYTLDANDPTISFFDIVAFKTSFSSGVETATDISLQQCQADSWNHSQKIRNDFQRLNGTRWLCPVPGQQAVFGGTWSGESQESIRFQLYPCGTKDSTKTNCANSSQISELFAQRGNNIFFILMTVNTLLEPQQVDPISYYIEDRLFLVFSETLGHFVFSEISQYEIHTDNSLLPFEDVSVQKGPLMSEQRAMFHFDRTSVNDPYMRCVVSKSPNKIEINRSFNKIDETVSYAGGLIGVVVGLFFIMAPYTELSFELSLANRLFRDQKQEPVKTSFNFLKYILYGLYQIFRCCLSQKSEEYELLYQCSEHVQKQLDISYLIMRLIRLQSILQKHYQIKNCPFSFQRITFDEAEVKLRQVTGCENDSAKVEQSICHPQVVDRCVLQENGVLQDKCDGDQKWWTPLDLGEQSFSQDPGPVLRRHSRQYTRHHRLKEGNMGKASRKTSQNLLVWPQSRSQSVSQQPCIQEPCSRG